MSSVSAESGALPSDSLRETFDDPGERKISESDGSGESVGSGSTIDHGANLV